MGSLGKPGEAWEAWGSLGSLEKPREALRSLGKPGEAWKAERSLGKSGGAKGSLWGTLGKPRGAWVPPRWSATLSWLGGSVPYDTPGRDVSQGKPGADQRFAPRTEKLTFPGAQNRVLEVVASTMVSRCTSTVLMGYEVHDK